MRTTTWLWTGCLAAPCGAQVSFQPQVLYPPGTSVVVVETADVDGDGHPDAIVADFGDIAGGLVSVLRGAGDGTLAAPETYAAGTIHLALAVADLDGDGAVDLALANFGGGSVSVLLNRGDGTFGGAVDYPAGVSLPRGIAAGDVDGDGDLDLVVGDAFASTHAVLLNDGAGVFHAGPVFAGGATTIDVKLADLDGDGDLDAIFVFNGLSVHLNDGAGTFAAPFMLQAGQYTAVVAIDADGDGDVDLAASRLADVIVYLNSGDGVSYEAAAYPVPTLTRDIASGDFNADGRPDLVTSHVADVNKVAVLLNLGGGVFAAAVEFTPGIYPQSVSAADLDGDGRDDLVAGLEFDVPPSVSVLVSDAVLPGDLNGDGVVDTIDFLALLAAWGICPVPPPACAADLDGDGAVGVLDLLALLANWS